MSGFYYEADQTGFFRAARRAAIPKARWEQAFAWVKQAEETGTRYINAMAAAHAWKAHHPDLLKRS